MDDLKDLSSWMTMEEMERTIDANLEIIRRALRVLKEGSYADQHKEHGPARVA